MFGNSAALTLAPPGGPKHPASTAGAAQPFHQLPRRSSQIRISTARGAIRSRYRFPATPSKTGSSVERWPRSSAATAQNCMTRSLCRCRCQSASAILFEGAYGYFGSSTIAYGPAEGNGAADLITQYFLLAMLDGASLGRAALLARQRFVQQTAELDPMDLKTLGQFNLLGDPSVHPAANRQCDKRPEGHRHRTEQPAGTARTSRQDAGGRRAAAGDQADSIA